MTKGDISFQVECVPGEAELNDRHNWKSLSEAFEEVVSKYLHSKAAEGKTTEQPYRVNVIEQREGVKGGVLHRWIVTLTIEQVM
jgi:hypothetical protein